MRIELAQPYRCRLGHDHKAGDTCDLPDHVAIKLMRLGIGRAVREAPIERTVKQPPETTVKAVKRAAPKKEVK